MAHCWDEYMWKAHAAVPVDPWATDVQLLDVFIPERCPPVSWFQRSRHNAMPPKLSRAGSMFSLASPHSCKPTVNTETPAQPLLVHKNSDSTTERPIDASLFVKASTSMPDMAASFKSSASSVASFAGASLSSAQFDVKGSKTVACNVGGVESQRVELDALMELLIPRTSSGLPAWQPDISLPQLQWSSKRGQTLWVVMEILYANSIKIDAENQAQAGGKTKVSGGAKVEVSEQVGVDKEGMWTVIAPKGKAAFPFAVRLHELRYEACGSLIVTSNNNLKRNNSLNTILRTLSSKHLSRSSSTRSQHHKPSNNFITTM